MDKKYKCAHFKPVMYGLKRMCKLFYQLPGCGAGGPLHVLLDDDNYDIDSIMFCLEECLKHEDERVRTLGSLICNTYLSMDIRARSTFDAYWCGQSLDCDFKCDLCDVRGDLYDFMCEKEKVAEKWPGGF